MQAGRQSREFLVGFGSAGRSQSSPPSPLGHELVETRPAVWVFRRRHAPQILQHLLGVVAVQSGLPVEQRSEHVGNSPYTSLGPMLEMNSKEREARRCDSG